MLARTIEVAVDRARRVTLWGGYATFVAIVAASWVSTRPASAQVAPGEALGSPRAAGSDATVKDESEGAPDTSDDAPDDAPTLRHANSDEPAFGPPAPRPRDPERTPASIRSEQGDAEGLRGRLNLNNATKAELERLPGIGDAISDRILAWREKHVRFHRVVDLRRVRGIGPVTLEKLRPYLTVIGPTTLRASSP